MAEAFGGKVIKSPRGWGIGLHRYDVQERADWMDDARSIAVPASHQDQIVKLPADARVLGGSEFTRTASSSIRSDGRCRCSRIRSSRPNTPSALIELRRSSKYTQRAGGPSARQTLREPNDRARVGTWLAEFLRSNIRG